MSGVLVIDVEAVQLMLRWSDRAACLGEDQEKFFQGQGHGERPDEARALCTACPVREECLDHALTQNETEGVWGGLTAKERQKLKRKRPRR